jgi:hypothetical protein
VKPTPLKHDIPFSNSVETGTANPFSNSVETATANHFVSITPKGVTAGKEKENLFKRKKEISKTRVQKNENF